jgi:hypothetical protein
MQVRAHPAPVHRSAVEVHDLEVTLSEVESQRVAAAQAQ